MFFLAQAEKMAFRRAPLKSRPMASQEDEVKRDMWITVIVKRYYRSINGPRSKRMYRMIFFLELPLGGFFLKTYSGFNSVLDDW